MTCVRFVGACCCPVHPEELSRLCRPRRGDEAAGRMQKNVVVVKKKYLLGRNLELESLSRGCDKVCEIDSTSPK